MKYMVSQKLEISSLKYADLTYSICVCLYYWSQGSLPHRTTLFFFSSTLHHLPIFWPI